jgi:Ser/Thr protein kinase RdoA (MazF antagonist)
MHQVCYSILSADAVLKEVSQWYRLDSPLSCHLLRRELHDTYLLTTLDNRYVVRVHGTRQRTESDLGCELALLAHLAARGVSVPVPVPDRNGNLWRTLVAPEGTRRLVLFPYVEGELLSWNDGEHCYLAGRLLASIHSALENFQSAYSRVCLDLSYLIDAPLTAVRPFLTHRPQDWTFLERFACQLRARAEDAIQGGLDWGWCHGGWNSVRIHISNDFVCTPLDFDPCGLGWRAYDLGAIHWIGSGNDTGKIWDSFVRGYTDIRQVKSVDLESVPVFDAISRLAMLGSCGANAHRWGVLRLDLRLDRELAFLRDWEATNLGEIGRKSVGIEPALATAAEDPNEKPALGELFPVTHSILSGHAVAAAAEQAYCLQTPVSCLLLKQSLNDTYLLTAGNQPYIVRVYGARWRTLSDVTYELELLQHLVSKGVSVAAPIVTRSGDLSCTLLTPDGPRQFAIFTYVPGKALSWNPETHSYEAGRMAALIHTASDDFVSRHARSCLDLTYMIDRPLAMVCPFLADRPDDWKYLQGFAARLHAWAAEAIGAGLDWGPCHGDFGVKNMHLAADGTVTVLDFDFCGPGWRIYDFTSAYRAGLEQPKNKIWDAFLKGYTAIRPISAVDLTAVPLFRALRSLAMLGVFAENVAQWGVMPLSARKLNKQIAYFRQCEAEYLAHIS